MGHSLIFVIVAEILEIFRYIVGLDHCILALGYRRHLMSSYIPGPVAARDWTPGTESQIKSRSRSPHNAADRRFDVIQMIRDTDKKMFIAAERSLFRRFNLRWYGFEMLRILEVSERKGLEISLI